LKLTVLSVAYPLAPVSADAVGGAEQVLATLDRALTKEGHESIVIACEGSSVAGTLISVPAPSGDIHDEVHQAAHRAVRDAIAATLSQTHVDLIHLHGVDFMAYLPAGEVPVLVTLHLPPEWYIPDVFQISRPNTYLNCVSESQRRRCPPGTVLRTIENGVDVSAFRPGQHKMSFTLALGRICPEKGYHIALDAAARAGVGCVIGGEVFRYAAHEEYFRRELAPRFDKASGVFLGKLEMRQKRNLLAAARCVLIPSLAPETSSLVAMEALASGTPVVAFPSGALAEIVEHGKTGYLVRDEHEMADAIGHAGDIDAAQCRSVAETRFSTDRMIRQYFETYASIRRPRLKVRSELRTLKPEWSELFRHCPDASPFASPVWLLAWWSVFGGAPLEVIAIRDAGRLAALLPLYWYQGRKYGVGNGITDCLDCLALPDAESAAAAAMWRRLQPCDLRSLPAHSLLVRYAERPVEETDPCLVVHLADDTWCKALARSTSSQRRLKRLGLVEFECATTETLPRYLDALFHLDSAQWASKNGPGVLADQDTQRFHRLAAPALMREGMARLYGARVNGELKAILNCLTRGKRNYDYISGFDPALSGYGLGWRLLHRAMSDARDAGHTEFDFLRGNEPYKVELGAKPRPTYRILID
jgi:glycosyltransferase involved in cell wall biosynthesis